MARRRDLFYPGRFTAADADHPLGAFKNRSTPGAGDGSYLDEGWANDMIAAFERAMTLAGGTVNGAADTAISSQLFDWIRMSVNAQSGNANFYTDSGAANSYVLTPISGNANPIAYAAGMTVIAYITNANTGASTANVAGLGVKDISSTYGSLTALTFGQMTGFSELVYDGTRLFLAKSGSTSVGTIGSNLTVTVGTGGDFSTINAAITYLSKFYPIYVSGGFTATINLLAGFVMTEQVIVTGIDLLWIKITGVDAVTTIQRSALTTAVDTIYGAFVAHNGGSLPVIDQLFTMDTSGTAAYRSGIYVKGAGSAVNVTAGSGVKNCARFGIIAVDCASANVEFADFSGSMYPVYANNCGKINGNNVNASSAVDTGISADTCGVIDANNANASNAGNYGVLASNASIINFNGGSATGALSIGIYASDLSKVNAHLASARKTAGVDSTTDVVVDNGGFIMAPAVGSGGISQPANIPTTNGIIFR